MPKPPKTRYFKLKPEFVEKGAAILMILTDKNRLLLVDTDGNRGEGYVRKGETAEDWLWDYKGFYDEIPAAEAALIF